MSRHHNELDRRRWEVVRRRILKKFNWRCAVCNRYGNEVDHIQPLHLGGAPWDENNLQVLCKTDHIIKTRSENCKPVSEQQAEWQAFIQELL